MYLSTGLALILAFIGVMLILHWAHVDIDPSVPEIPTPVSLTVIIALLVVVTVASLIKTRNDPTAKAHAGSLRARPTAPGETDDKHLTRRWAWRLKSLRCRLESGRMPRSWVRGIRHVATVLGRRRGAPQRRLAGTYSRSVGPT